MRYTEFEPTVSDEDYRPLDLRGSSFYNVIMRSHYNVSRNTNIQDIRFPLGYYGMARGRIPISTINIELGPAQYYEQFNLAGENIILADVIKTTETMDTEALEINATTADLLDALSRPPTNNYENPIIDLAFDIYKKLYINYPKGFAHFMLEFDVEGRKLSFNLNRPRRTIYIRVRLGIDMNIIVSESLYIAYRIAKNFRDWVKESAQVSEEEIFDIRSVSIVEICKSNYYTFSHVIQGYISVQQLKSLGYSSTDIFVSHDFKVLFKTLRNQKLMLSSPSSVKNCLYLTYLMCKYNIHFESLSFKNRITLQKRASRIAKRSLEEIVEYNEQIIFVNYLLHPVYIIQSFQKSNIEKTYKILLFGNHAFSIIKDERVKSKEKKYRKIYERDIDHKRTNIKFGVFDIETFVHDVEPYYIGYKLHGEPPVLIPGLDCIGKYFRNLSYKKGTIYQYAHYGGKFDFVILLRYLLNQKHWKITNIFEKDGGIFKMVIVFPKRNGEKVVVVFLDSWKILPVKLKKLAKSFNVDHKKRKMDYEAVNRDNFMQEIKRQKIDKYLEHDILGLYEILELYNTQIFKQFGFYPIGNVATLPSMVRFLFLAKYYNKLTTPLYHLPRKLDEFIRRNAYMGGRTDVMRRGVFMNSLYYVDITSHYPDQCFRKKLPVGIPVYFAKDQIDLETFFGFIEYVVKGGRKDHWNPIRQKTVGGLHDPYFELPTRKLMFSEEFKWIYKNRKYFNYKIKIIGGYYFDSTYFLRDIAFDLFELKKNAKDNVIREIAKLFINCLYGIFALKTVDSQIKLINKIGKINKYLATGNLLEIHGKLAKVRDGIETCVRSIPVSAAITSYAHLKLIKIIDSAEKDGMSTYYCDTDSLLGEITPEWLQRKGLWGRDMGQFHYEVPNVHEACIVAKKIYALKALNKDNVMEEIIKMKGIPKKKWEISNEENKIVFKETRINGEYIKFEHVEALLDNIKLAFKFRSFECGKRGLLTDSPKHDSRIKTVVISGGIPGKNIQENGEVHPMIIK